LKILQYFMIEIPNIFFDSDETFDFNSICTEEIFRPNKMRKTNNNRKVNVFIDQCVSGMELSTIVDDIGKLDDSTSKSIGNTYSMLSNIKDVAVYLNGSSDYYYFYYDDAFGINTNSPLLDEKKESITLEVRVNIEMNWHAYIYVLYENEKKFESITCDEPTIEINTKDDLYSIFLSIHDESGKSDDGIFLFIPINLIN